MIISRALKTSLPVLLLLISFNIFSQGSRKFVVILDAGHGGKDPGNSYHGFVEKDIALKTTLKVEKYLQSDSDIKVIFTRKKDVFIELKERPKVANSIDANLFISIHCNSVSNPNPYGTETFIMGLARSNTNFEIAKKENSVILLEKDYKRSYKGFDPNRPETMVGLKIMQEEYLNRSISLAAKIEKNFTHKLNRKSRGIKQTPLWVLDAAYMPSVLIELGFLSNREEGTFLNSDEGQEAMAKTIAEAIISYKKQYTEGESEVAQQQFSKVNRKDTAVIKSESNTKTFKSSTETSVLNTDDAIIYKVQIAASKRNLKLVPSNFNGLKDISIASDNGVFYKYMYGATTDIKTAQNNLEVAKAKGYSSAYLIAFKNGEKISMQDATK